MASSSKSSDGRFLLVFGSQTGQAKAIAEIIRDKALEKGLKPDLYCISLSGKKVHEVQACISLYIEE